MSRTDAVLTVRALTCRLDGRLVLDRIDLDLYPGELVGIIGPNGAGKSTLLHCLNGTAPSTGSIDLGGVPVAGLSPRKVALAMALMPQNTTVTFPFPARDVVMMGRYPHRRRFQGESPEDQRMVDAAMQFTGTDALADQPVTRMSGGERQRVLFAKTLAQDTLILLLDEPTSNLDFSYQEQIFRSAKNLADRGKTVVAAIHDLRTAARFCTRLVLLVGGRILVGGAPEDVLTPAHLWSAWGVRVNVYRNPVTGHLDYDFADPAH